MDAGTIQNWYKECRSYFNAMKFTSLFPRCERFLNNDQWPPPTPKTKDFPRPVVNVISFIESHKISNIINDPVKMVFSPDDQDETDEMTEIGAELFTQYSSTEWENVEQDELNENALGLAANLGAGIWHYYWDANTKQGKKRVSIGQLKGEILDPINVKVGNPQCVNTQLQPYILIDERKDIDLIKEEARANGISEILIEEIKPDKDFNDDLYDTTRNEVKDKATLITAYQKINGTIHLMKICGDIPIMNEVDTMKKLYPIVKMNWYKRNKSWYGQGETERLIDNQKAINLMVAMQIKSGEFTGLPKLMLKSTVQDWNNDPQEAMIDNSDAGKWGAAYLQPAAISPHVPNLVDFLMENVKALAGASETSTGDISGLSNISPTVVLSLQQQAQMPIESIKKRFKRAMKEVGEIWLEFWTMNYNTTKTILVTKLNPETNQEEELPQDFKGTDFKDISLKLKIDIGTSQAFSDQMLTTVLDKLYADKIIDGRTKVEFYPESAMPFKNELLKKIDQQQAQQQMLQHQNIPTQNNNIGGIQNG